MKKSFWALAILTVLSGRSPAALWVDDHFDVYESQLMFEAVWIPIGTNTPASGELSTAQAVSSPNSVEVKGTVDPGKYRNQFTFDSSTPLLNVGDQLVWSFDYYDKLPGGNPRNNFATLQTDAVPDGATTGQIISLGLGGNQSADDSGGNRYMASILGYSHAAMDPDGGDPEAAAGTGPGAFFKLNDTGAGLRGENDGWHNLKLIISTSDGTTVDHAYYVDGALAETVTNVGPNLQYTVIRLGSGLSNAGVGAFFDNMRLEHLPAAIPEAGSFVAMGVVALLSLGGVWLRKRALQSARAA